MLCVYTSVSILMASIAEVPDQSSVVTVSPFNCTLFIVPCELVRKPAGDSLNQHHELSELSPTFLFGVHKNFRIPPSSIRTKQSDSERGKGERRVGLREISGFHKSRWSLSCYSLALLYLLEFSIL